MLKDILEYFYDPEINYEERFLMDKLFKQAKAFISCMKIRIIQDNYNSVKLNLDTKQYISYSVSIINPRNEMDMKYIAYRDNIIINTNDDFIKKTFIMDILLDYLYKTEDNSNTRDKFSKIFNENEIKLMISYFKYFPCFKKAVIKLSG